MRGIKCGKSQIRGDEATRGLINGGGRTCLHIAERKGASFGTCISFEQQLQRIVELEEGQKCWVQLKLAGTQRNLSDICENRLQLLGVRVLHFVSSTLGLSETPH